MRLTTIRHSQWPWQTFTLLTPSLAVNHLHTHRSKSQHLIKWFLSDPDTDTGKVNLEICKIFKFHMNTAHSTTVAETNNSPLNLNNTPD